LEHDGEGKSDVLMIDLKTVDENELRERIDTILPQLELVSEQLAPLLKSWGLLREEAQLIYAELQSREKSK